MSQDTNRCPNCGTTVTVRIETAPRQDPAGVGRQLVTALRTYQEKGGRL